jgi:hypothetical protein
MYADLCHFFPGNEAEASVVGCDELVNAAQKRATKVASSVSTGMRLEKELNRET